MPGRYRFHLELHEIGYNVEFEDASDPFAATTLDIRIVGPSATP